MTNPLSLFTGLSSPRTIDKYRKTLHRPRKPTKPKKRGMWNRKDSKRARDHRPTDA